MSFSVRATARYIPMSPRKVRLVLDLVRGRPVPEASATLRFATQAAAGPVRKVLESAAANAEENASASEEMSAQVEQMKRYVSDLVGLVGGGSRRVGSKEYAVGSDTPCLLPTVYCLPRVADASEGQPSSR